MLTAEGELGHSSAVQAAHRGRCALSAGLSEEAPDRAVGQGGVRSVLLSAEVWGCSPSPRKVQNNGVNPELICLAREGDGTHSRALAWRTPWTEEPGGLQSMGSQRVGHDWVTSLSLSCFGYLPKKASRLYLNVKKSVFFIHWDKEFLRDIVKSSSLVFKRHMGCWHVRNFLPELVWVQ